MHERTQTWVVVPCCFLQGRRQKNFHKGGGNKSRTSVLNTKNRGVFEIWEV